jgi:5,10-methylenetetrahydromethanopterin reductase
MDFGISIATSSDSWKLAQRAEELGFSHLETSRIRLGTGVLMPSNRIAV